MTMTERPWSGTAQVPFAMSSLHSRSYRQHRLATEWERAITNMHEELDRYLAG